MNFTRRRTQPSHPPFDVNQLEKEIRDTIPLPPTYVEIPPMLEQAQVTAEDLGRITAEAVAAAHEAAANSLSDLGKELADRIKSLDQLRLDADTALKACLDISEKYREAGRKAAEQIKQTAALTAEVTDTCEAMRKKLGE